MQFVRCRCCQKTLDPRETEVRTQRELTKRSASSIVVLKGQRVVAGRRQKCGIVKPVANLF
jgi:hypothetical protein